MKQDIFSLIISTVLLAACTTSAPQQETDITAYNDEQPMPGDSTIYGLACEGSTDSILVILPFTGGDPDTLDITEARENRRVLGRPDIGDEMAVIRQSGDSTKADFVVNLDRLKGSWCYMVTPTLKAPAGAKMPPLPDSLRRKWLQPREYGLEIKRDYTARTTGAVRPGEASQQTPVVYPELKRYREWHLLNGRLLLCEGRRDSLGKAQITSTDTADILLLRRDSLVIRFADHEQGFYRKALINQ